MNLEKSAQLRAVFTRQADYCEALGSPFMARALRIVRDSFDDATPVGNAVLNWPGNPEPEADSVPLRLMGGLHALVLTDNAPTLKRAYPPQERGDLRAVLGEALQSHAAFLLDWIKRAPQTNEVARQAPLIAAAHLLSDHYRLPIHLLELGASAGLNLRWHHTAVETSKGAFGASTPALALTPDWQGELPTPAAFEIASAKGVDLHPLDPSDPDAALRLLAYLWPDQPDRIARARAAIALAEKYPITLARGDAIDWLAGALPKRARGGLTILFHTVAWQYFPPAQQEKGHALIKAAGAQASADTPLAWLSMEADGATPGAALTLRLWPGDHIINLGRADFHGRWVRWDIGAKLPF